ncbi:MAG: LCP family protein, partial [Bacilli bacterium]|nr:LCP family protein [Bacilli bacterium]
MVRRIKTKEKNKTIQGLVMATFILLCTTSLYLIYNILLLSGIENIIRTGLITIIIIIVVIFFILCIKTIKGRKIQSVIIFIIISLLFSSAQYIGAHYINKAFSSINKMNKSEVTYSTSLVVMKTSAINTIADLKKKKIGIISDTNSIEGYIISQDIIKENNIDKNSLIEYDESVSMLNDLYEGHIDAMFISSGYVSIFSSIDHFVNIEKETKTITSKSKTMEKADEIISTPKIKISKPFTMLILGVQSGNDQSEGLPSSYNADTLILITFNPKTLNTTMLSIPRDTFVPIACFANQKQNKITHSGWNGESCVIKTVQNFTGININYYVKINFNGVVKLVDALNGIEVDVPYSFCEQNSKRQWGKNTVFVEKGKRILNGEQALALSRNRHKPKDGSDVGRMMGRYCPTYREGSRDDFARGQNQQLVIKGIANKAKEIRDINKLYKILDLLEKNMDTNMSTNQILSFYNIGQNILSHSKNQGDILSFQRLYLKTYGAMIYDEGMKQRLSNQIYYKGSLKDVVDAMEVNLGIKKPTITKNFSFSINEQYQQRVIGKGIYNEAGIKLVPDFTKYTKATATKWGNDNGIPIHFDTVESGDAKYKDGQIIKQDTPQKKLVSLVNKAKGITLTIV